MKLKGLIIGCISFFLSFGASASSMKEFVRHLETCEPYVMPYKNPFGDEMVKREVKGTQGGRCLFEETMPGNMSLVCEFTDAGRREAVSAYRKGGGSALASVMNGPECQIVDSQ